MRPSGMRSLLSSHPAPGRRRSAGSGLTLLVLLLLAMPAGVARADLGIAQEAPLAPDSEQSAQHDDERSIAPATRPMQQQSTAQQSVDQEPAGLQPATEQQPLAQPPITGHQPAVQQPAAEQPSATQQPSTRQTGDQQTAAKQQGSQEPVSKPAPQQPTTAPAEADQRRSEWAGSTKAPPGGGSGVAVARPPDTGALITSPPPLTGGAPALESSKTSSTKQDRLPTLVAQAREQLRHVRRALTRARRAVAGSGHASAEIRRELSASLGALLPILDTLAPVLDEPAQTPFPTDVHKLRRELALAVRSAQALLAALDRADADASPLARLRDRLQRLVAHRRATMPRYLRQPLGPPATPAAPSASVRLAYTQLPTAPKALSERTNGVVRATATADRPSHESQHRDAPGGRREDSTPPATGVAAFASAGGGGSAPAAVPAALVTLLSLLAPALVRRLVTHPDGRRPLGFVPPLERPG